MSKIEISGTDIKFYRIFDNNGNKINTVLFVGQRMFIYGYTGTIANINHESEGIFGDNTTITVKMDSEEVPDIIITEDLLEFIKPIAEINGNNHNKYYFAY